ncbi:hypothetical protein AB4851_12620 [Burkholderia sp. 22PA0099]|uniref:hypothetical protein n=1 Tax=Burkholderia sp. 22PA0099 TaxID=3237372 RepID=UPI0039C42C44
MEIDSSRDFHLAVKGASRFQAYPCPTHQARSETPRAPAFAFLSIQSFRNTGDTHT